MDRIRRHTEPHIYATACDGPDSHLSHLEDQYFHLSSRELNF